MISFRFFCHNYGTLIGMYVILYEPVYYCIKLYISLLLLHCSIYLKLVRRREEDDTLQLCDLVNIRFLSKLKRIFRCFNLFWSVILCGIINKFHRFFFVENSWLYPGVLATLNHYSKYMLCIDHSKELKLVLFFNIYVCHLFCYFLIVWWWVTCVK